MACIGLLVSVREIGGEPPEQKPVGHYIDAGKPMWCNTLIHQPLSYLAKQRLFDRRERNDALEPGTHLLEKAQKIWPWYLAERIGDQRPFKIQRQNRRFHCHLPHGYRERQKPGNHRLVKLPAGLTKIPPADHKQITGSHVVHRVQDAMALIKIGDAHLPSGRRPIWHVRLPRADHADALLQLMSHPPPAR